MKNKITIIVMLVISTVFSLMVFINIAPNNPLVDKNFMFYIAPQGFAFYSKSPTDDMLVISNDSPEVYIPNATPKNLFGLSRKGRAQMVELGSIEQNYPNNMWEKCSTEKNCLTKLKDKEPIMIDKEFKHLESGIYTMYYRDVIAWYWTDFKETSSFDGRVIKVQIP